MFSQIYFVPFFDGGGGGVFQFFGNTVICLKCPIKDSQTIDGEKKVGEICTFPKIICGKKFRENKQNKSPPDFLGKKVPVGRSTQFFLFEGGLSI